MKRCVKGSRRLGANFEERTCSYWRHWVHRLAIPFEWQGAVIRAAITLKALHLRADGSDRCRADDQHSGKSRHPAQLGLSLLRVRDAYFVVRALNRLAAVRKMENYFRWLMNIVAS